MKLLLSIFALYLVFTHEHYEEPVKEHSFWKYKADHSRIYRREMKK